jgi:hypothetical protein
MPQLARQLDRATDALRRSAGRVRRGSVYTLAPAHLREPHVDIRPRRGDTALDQSVAALQAVVWIAAFVQSVFNEIAGRSDDL